MSKKCLVIGGGFAGLSAAAFLTKNKIQVTLLESSPKLGGRAYSFFDKKTDTVLDNGQHILMGCYTETLSFLKLIGAENNFEYQQQLKVNFVRENFNLSPLKAFPIFYPLNLLIGLLNFKAISITERINLLRVLIKLSFIRMEKLKNQTIEEWLNNEKQSESIKEAFWKILSVGALNTSIYNASAKIFVDVLKQIFLNGNFACTIILPKYGLGESYSNDAKNFIENNGGEIILSEKVYQIKVNYGMVTEVLTDKTAYNNFDLVISTVPSFALNKISTNAEIIFPEFTYSSILNVHIWLKENPLIEKFYGLIGSPVHWVFSKTSHLNVVISDADNFIEKTDEEIVKLITAELKKYLRINESSIVEYKIIKEKRATFVPSINIIDSRPSSKTNVKNLFLAGDWVDTGLPSTIESAVKSGRIAAELVLGQI
ncbi:MAG: hydroxysqualene dehydroxylase HpnE [Promethearchaeota archaeon]|jgi:squalene-associated FAD-dependent desaturase